MIWFLSFLLLLILFTLTIHIIKSMLKYDSYNSKKISNIPHFALFLQLYLILETKILRFVEQNMETIRNIFILELI